AELLYSTYFSGNGYSIDGVFGIGDGALGIVVNNGKVFITGATSSTSGFPLSAHACQTSDHSTGILGGIPMTAFVAELDPTQPIAANQLVFSTYLGGSGPGEIGVGIGVDTSIEGITS